ncbi:MAG TPA: diguanylate cyclase [Thiohalobacter sp.]|nr:diguanylate cyclase [Thiohalobacter sp.]
MSEENTPTGTQVLVVDDSRVIRVAARKILKEEFEVLEAGDGEAAWDALQQNPGIALVISDLSMPYLNGMDLLKRIREAEDKHLANLPVIIVTGAEDDEDAKSSAFAAGASDFLSKPFDSVQLLAHTRSHIKLATTETRLEQTATAIETEPTVDLLTGLLNQRSFTDRGHQELAYAIRHRSELGLVFIDVDAFDEAFIKYGKPAGEAILKIFTRIIQDSIRAEDTAGRVGLARFGLVLPSANAVGARKLAMRICTQIASRTFKIGNETLRLTASAGVITPLIRRETRFEELLEQAQRLLGRAQHSGGNRVLFDQGTAASDEREAVVAEAGGDTAGNEAAAQPEVPAVSAAGHAPATPAPQPEAGSEPEPEPAPTLEQALQRLRHSGEAAVAPHLPGLIRELLPLLEAWQRRQDGRLDEALERIRASLYTPGSRS